VLVQPYPPHAPGTKARVPPALTHPVAVRCLLPLALTPLGEPYLLTGAGDVIRAYDLTTVEEPEALGATDAHWHDVTALRLWLRRVVPPSSATSGQDGGNTEKQGEDKTATSTTATATAQVRVEPWVVSASLDGTLRKWKLLGESHPRLPAHPRRPRISHCPTPTYGVRAAPRR
jgi:hypothetical protein